MTLNEFDAYWKSLCEEERQTLLTKGQEYSGREDRFANFKRLAVTLKMDPKQILWVYLTKHLDSITSFLRGEYSGVEPIRGRIVDARNYLALLAGMIDEEE